MKVELTRLERRVMDAILDWDSGNSTKPLTTRNLALLTGTQDNRSYLRKLLRKLEASELISTRRVKSRGIEVTDIRPRQSVVE